MKTKVVLPGITATLALALTGCGEPTTLAEICKADMGSIKHFKGEVKVYKRVSYTTKYDIMTNKYELKEDGKGYLIVDKDTKVDLDKFNEKESDSYEVIKNSIAQGIPYYYGEQKYGEIGDENATEFLATLETLNPRCIKGEEIKLNRKDTELTPKK
jgi:putative lipoprotein